MLKTWDIFDTLIARRCVAPHLIFQIIEQKFNIGGFAQARIMAESRVRSRTLNYNFDDIYNEFQKIVTNVDSNLCQQLKKIECNTEIEQAIPITENILQVKAGDILISDMYLPEEIIRKMLLKCGLIAPVEICLTSNGKYTGKIWKQIADQNEFVFHVGDNEIVDIKNSRDAGFDSALTITSRPNIVENYLFQKDFWFASYLREIRLKNPYQEETKRRYWELFTLNIGILIILVQLIDAVQKKCGFEYLGFCGRDTYYMWLLYQKFKEDKNEALIPCDYLHYSRKLIHTSQKEMSKYCSSKITGKKSLLIDLIGSGTHLNKLREITKLNCAILMCFRDAQEDIGKRYKIFPPKNWTLVNTLQDKISNPNLNLCFLNYNASEFDLNRSQENFNKANHNSPIKLSCVKIGKKNIPNVIFNEINDIENQDVFEKCIREVLNSHINWLSNINGGGYKILEHYEEIFEIYLKPLLTFFTASVNSSLKFQRESIREAVDIQTTLKK